MMGLPKDLLVQKIILFRFLYFSNSLFLFKRPNGFSRILKELNKNIGANECQVKPKASFLMTELLIAYAFALKSKVEWFPSLFSILTQFGKNQTTNFIP